MYGKRNCEEQYKSCWFQQRIKKELFDSRIPSMNLVSLMTPSQQWRVLGRDTKAQRFLDVLLESPFLLLFQALAQSRSNHSYLSYRGCWWRPCPWYHQGMVWIFESIHWTVGGYQSRCMKHVDMHILYIILYVYDTWQYIYWMARLTKWNEKCMYRADFVIVCSQQAAFGLNRSLDTQQTCSKPCSCTTSIAFSLPR